jgi:large subunit ribosomal protein L10
MSKYVKNLIADDVKGKLAGVNDALLVNVIGIPANDTYVLRKELRQKNIHLLVVKNSLAKRATEGTPLSNAFNGIEGTTAIVWGGEDFVSLAKEITAIDKSEKFKTFATRGGVMDGDQLSPERVKEIAKWPNRAQQLSILVGQILSPGANLVSQLTSAGGALASQIKQKSEGEETAPAAEAAPAAETAPAADAAPAAKAPPA